MMMMTMMRCPCPASLFFSLLLNLLFAVGRKWHTERCENCLHYHYAAFVYTCRVLIYFLIHRYFDHSRPNNEKGGNDDESTCSSSSSSTETDEEEEEEGEEQVRINDNGVKNQDRNTQEKKTSNGGGAMVSRRKILSRSRDDLNVDFAPVIARDIEEDEEDVWYHKDKLYRVSYRSLLIDYLLHNFRNPHQIMCILCTYCTAYILRHLCSTVHCSIVHFRPYH